MVRVLALTANRKPLTTKPVREGRELVGRVESDATVTGWDADHSPLIPARNNCSLRFSGARAIDESSHTESPLTSPCTHDRQRITPHPLIGPCLSMLVLMVLLMMGSGIGCSALPRSHREAVGSHARLHEVLPMVGVVHHPTRYELGLVKTDGKDDRRNVTLNLRQEVCGAKWIDKSIEFKIQSDQPIVALNNSSHVNIPAGISCIRRDITYLVAKGNVTEPKKLRQKELVENGNQVKVVILNNITL